MHRWATFGIQRFGVWEYYDDRKRYFDGLFFIGHVNNARRETIPSGGGIGKNRKERCRRLNTATGSAERRAPSFRAGNRH